MFVRMAVVVKRAVQLYYWKARKFQPLQDDIVLTDVPHSIQWCKGALVVDQYCGYTKVQVGMLDTKIDHSLNRTLVLMNWALAVH